MLRMSKLLLLLILAAPLAAADFDYYMLTLSWAPDFCAQSKGAGPAAECGAGRKIGFVVHGFWPQSNAGRGPENCGKAKPVAASLAQSLLSYIPTTSLVQHEWKAHGTCSGLSAADYFGALKKARDSVTIPAQFQAPAQAMKLTPGAIEASFAAANPSFPPTAFVTSCTGGALQEARICFSKNFTPQACTKGAGECTMASINVLPVK